MGGSHPAHSRAVQVDPIKPTLEPPGSERLKPKYDTLLSNVAFKSNLRRYSTELNAMEELLLSRRMLVRLPDPAGAYIRPLFGSA